MQKTNLIDKKKSIIYCTKNHKIFVDKDDIPLLSRWTWTTERAGRRRYASTTIMSRKVYMHRLILGSYPNGYVCDHIDWNGLNNKKENLRICKSSANVQNIHPKNSGVIKSSKFKGVSIGIKARKWRASISFRGRRVFLGSFDNEISAAKTYDMVALNYFGKECFTNYKSIMRKQERRKYNQTPICITPLLKRIKRLA